MAGLFDITEATAQTHTVADTGEVTTKFMPKAMGFGTFLTRAVVGGVTDLSADENKVVLAATSAKEKLVGQLVVSYAVDLAHALINGVALLPLTKMAIPANRQIV